MFVVFGHHQRLAWGVVLISEVVVVLVTTIRHQFSLVWEKEMPYSLLFSVRVMGVMDSLVEPLRWHQWFKITSQLPSPWLQIHRIICCTQLCQYSREIQIKVNNSQYFHNWEARLPLQVLANFLAIDYKEPHLP